MANIQEGEKGIIENAGKLGVQRRDNNRLVVNGRRVSNNTEEFERNLGRLFAIGERHPDLFGRTFFRGVVTSEVREHIEKTPHLRRQLEVSVPLDQHTGDGSHLVYIAKNRPGRDPKVPIEFMTAATEQQNSNPKSPLERINAVVEKGFSFTNTITDVEQVHELWGPAFGWELQHVNNLKKRLEKEKDSKPEERHVWFTAITHNGLVVSLAMAERLKIPTSGTGFLDLIESTEWNTRKGFEDNGFMSTTAAMLNGQVLFDLYNNPDGLPLIYAECRFASRADRAGYGAGFRIPSRKYAKQMLIQNVEVQRESSDFTYMHVPVPIIGQHYKPDQVDAMMSNIQR